MSDGRGGRGNAKIGSELTVQPSQDRAIDALPPLQAAWVRAKVERGCSNTEAARLAGYDATPDSLKTIGYRLSHEKRVRLALFEECQTALHTSSAVAVRVLEDIAADPSADNKDRVRASVEILNRSGLHAMSEHRVVVDNPKSRAELVASLIDLCAKSGLDAAKMLGVDKAAVTDAEFVDVTAPEPARASFQNAKGGLDPVLDVAHAVGLRRDAPTVALLAVAGGAENPSFQDLKHDWLRRRRLARFNAAQTARQAEITPAADEADDAGLNRTQP